MPDLSQRDAEIVMLRTGGATLQQIGDAIQMTREGVRLRLVAAGYGEKTTKGPDPILVCRAAERATDLGTVAKAAKTYTVAVRQVLRALGKWDAFRDRMLAYAWAYRYEAALAALRALAARLGHTPTTDDIKAAGLCTTTYVRQWGTLRRAQAAAGLVPNQLGGDRYAARRTA